MHDMMVEDLVENLVEWLSTFHQLVERMIQLTVRDVVKKTGLSASAVYKKIKSHGLKMETIKDQETGHFTPDAEKKIMELFNLAENQDTGTEDQVDNQAEKVDNQAEKVDEKLTIELEKLKIRIEALEDQIEQLKGERDYLRQALAAAVNKIPPALPAPEKRGIFGWFSRKRGGHDAD